MQAGGEPAQLIVLRGNSGSGKSSVAAEMIMSDAGWPAGGYQETPGQRRTARPRPGV